MHIYELLNEFEVWHGSFRPRIGKFKPFSHFGTEQAARDRLEGAARHSPQYKGQTTGYLYRLDLGIKSPARVKDYTELPDISTGSLRKLAMWAKDIAKDDRAKTFKMEVSKNRYSKEKVMMSGSDILKSYARLIESGYWHEWTTIGDIIGNFVNLCKKMNIDGLIYRNQVENKGKDSYIIFDPASVRVIGRAKPIDLTIYTKNN